VLDTRFHDATLVLVGHGSTTHAGSRAPVLRHAESLRQRHLFAEVLETFWVNEPRVTTLWNRVRTSRVFIVPLFTSTGYFTTEAIPEALGLRHPRQVTLPRHQMIHGHIVHYTEPIGTHPAMTQTLERQALLALEESSHLLPRPDPSHTSLVVAGHGTHRNRHSRKCIEAHVQQLAQRGNFAHVSPAFLEESPLIADCVNTCLTRDLVVVPFFMSNGLHTAEDIPILLGRDAAEVRQRITQDQPTWSNPTPLGQHRVWYTNATGEADSVADLILARVREAA
jgi:sirohydrochlorin cobaltochelatase